MAWQHSATVESSSLNLNVKFVIFLFHRVDSLTEFNLADLTVN